VAVVGPDNKVQLRSIRLGRDFGNTIEVLSGVSSADRVIMNPSDGIADGDTVQPAHGPETYSAK
jgi:hypothetical protein